MEVFDITALYFTSMTPRDKLAMSAFFFRLWGVIYMFCCRLKLFPSIQSVLHRIDKVTVSARKGFIVKNMIFILAYAHAIFSEEIAPDRMDFLINLLLMCESIVSYVYYPHLIPIDKGIHRLELLRQIARNIFIANFLCVTKSSQFPTFGKLSSWEVVSVTSGLFLFFTGMRTKMMLDKNANASRPPSQWRVNRGGIYEIVVAPEQLASVLKWLGFYMICRTEVAFGFFCYKFQIAFGKCILIHEQNLLIDPEYIKDRKFVCPFLVNWKEEAQPNR